MLGRFPVIFRFLEPGKIRGRGGEAAHGFMLNVVASISESYAQYLHNMRGVKPFSLSPLFCEDKGGWKLEGGFLIVKKDTEGKIFVSALDEDTLSMLLKAFINVHISRKEMIFGGLKVRVERVCVKEEEGARFERYSRIMDRVPKSERVVFNFLTPASFRQNGIQFTFPVPELLFSSLLHTWNAFSDVKISEELKEKFKFIGISRYQLRSELWHFSGYKIFGCRGRVEYFFGKHFREDELKFLNSLSLFAEFSGVGYKKTMGLGVVEVKCGK